MLTLTENAASAVKNITAQVPTDTGGIRISDSGSPDTGFALAVAPAPEAQDAVIETDGARVFVDQAASIALDDRILDAQVDDDGSVRFALAQRG